MNMRFFLDNAWRRSAGLPEVELNSKVKVEDTFKRFDERFIRKMRKRIGMGFFRYGDSKSYNYLEGIKKKLARYEETKNLEFLVDVANYAMLEFNDPILEGTYFEAIDDDEESHLKPLDYGDKSK